MSLLLMPHLTFYERQKIEHGKRVGKSHRAIGKQLNRDHRVIDREVDRNSSEHLSYNATSAQHILENRQRKKKKRKLEKPENSDLREYVIQQLKEDWSPEEIAGRLKNHPPEHLKGKKISHESIYDYIYNGEGRYENLFHHLRTKRAKRRNKFNRKKRPKITIPNRVSVHERPAVVDLNKEFGHWETDSMIFSKQKEILSVQRERKSHICRIHKLPDKTAGESELAIQASIESVLPELWKTITRDNGTENAKHEDTLHTFNIQSYFCDAYKSYQKARIENTNKLIRRYLPRSTKMSTISDKEILLIQEKLNNRPRKTLNYLTPNEIIARHPLNGAFDS